MSEPGEEERAALWRKQRQNRAVFAAQLRATLTPPPEPANAVREDWEPVKLWLAERNLVEPEDQDSDRFNFGTKQDELRGAVQRTRSITPFNG
jgi:hypothetical protein